MKLKIIIITLTFIFSLGSNQAVFAENFNPETIYGEICSACHGFDGEGTSAEIPDFTLYDSVLYKDNAPLILSLIKGVEKSDGTVVMPPYGGSEEFTQTQALLFLNFLRETFGS
jgi:mono/diheme cytochrome c family protein